jgi:hypothetical protein
MDKFVTQTSPETRRRLRELLAKANAGPWRVEDDETPLYVWTGEGDDELYIASCWTQDADEASKANSALIAESHNALGSLLADADALAALQAKVAEIEAECEFAVNDSQPIADDSDGLRARQAGRRNMAKRILRIMQAEAHAQAD